MNGRRNSKGGKGAMRGGREGVSGVHIDERDVNCWRHCSLSLTLHLDVRLLLFLTDSLLPALLLEHCIYYYRPISFSHSFTNDFKRLPDDCYGTILGNV